MRWIEPPDGRPWALIALCGGSLLLNVVLVANLMIGGRAAEPAPVEIEVAAADVAPMTLDELAAPEGTLDAAATSAPAVVPEGVKVVRAEVAHSLARTFQSADPKNADVVSAIYARLFFWDLDLRRDLQRGDEVIVAYEWAGEFPDIPVASYRSGKLGRTLRAYRFQATGDDFASWWDESGKEVPRRLQNSPLASYEQVTSLIKDRPTHKGMDFKAPVGTPVVSPKAGTVVRTNWNFAYNGNCAEVRYSDGTIARFLHLSETAVRDGQQLAAGQKIGLSGNTGRSTAPHLHYELEKNERVIDPVDYHGTLQRTLPAGDRAAFEAEVLRLDRIIAGAS